MRTDLDAYANAVANAIWRMQQAHSDEAAAVSHQDGTELAAAKLQVAQAQVRLRHAELAQELERLIRTGVPPISKIPLGT